MNLAIKIGHACTACGNCDKSLPGIREEIKKRGSVFANPRNKDVNWEAIGAAINSCAVGAISLEEI